MDEKRRDKVRRVLGSMVFRDGEPQESKIFASIGKILCAWLIVRYGDLLIANSWALFIVLAIMIFPDVAKKAITMRFMAEQKEKKDAE